MPEPSVTRRENISPASPGTTRRETANGEPVATRHETGAATASWANASLDALPAALVGRLSDLRPMPAGGGEAQLALVRDSARPNSDLVLKIYYEHIQPDPEVWAQLTEIRSKHVVDVAETGTLTDGRVFELMEYLPNGSLRDAGAGKHAFDAASIKEIVHQLTTGLGALHSRRITHRDLKPENVLVRGTSPTIELVLADFGLSRRLNSTAHFTTVARTAAYAAPETGVGHVSPALDWWSLGVMVLELATGKQPFQNLNELVIQKLVTTKPVSVDAITDSRLNRLCAGLLVSDETKRWQEAEVREWLAGGAPAVPDRRVPVDATEFEFDGQRFRDPESLAAAMAGNWRLAARRYGISPSPSWTAFTTWLHQFDNPDQYPVGVVEARLDLLGQLEQSNEKPNVKLLRLLAGLNPQQPPIYRQAHIDAPKLRELARRAQDGPDGDNRTKQAREIVDELWEGRLLDVLARFDEAAELPQVATQWSAGIGELRAAVTTLKQNPRLTNAFDTTKHRSVARAAMLELAAGAARGNDWLGELDNRAKALPVRVDWFDDLVRWVGGDPARAYAGLFASGVAHAEAQQVLFARQVADQAQLARQQAWADREQRRTDGRGRALGRAAAGAAVLTGLWLLVMLFAAKTPMFAFVPVAMVTHFIVESALASETAADYHPRYSLWQAFQVAMGRIGGRLQGSTIGWTIGIVVLLVLLAFVPWLAPIAAVAATVAHIIWAVRRYGRWSAVHKAEQLQALNG